MFLTRGLKNERSFARAWWRDTKYDKVVLAVQEEGSQPTLYEDASLLRAFTKAETKSD